MFIFSSSDFNQAYLRMKYIEQFNELRRKQAKEIEKVKTEIVEILKTELNPKGIFDKSDATARNHEGLPVENGLLWGENPPEFLEVKENGIIYHINIAEGQKSGFYCDQRDNRKIVAAYAKDKKVLDCFSYSGGFSLNALASG